MEILYLAHKLAYTKFTFFCPFFIAFRLFTGISNLILNVYCTRQWVRLKHGTSVRVLSNNFLRIEKTPDKFKYSSMKSVLVVGVRRQGVAVLHEFVHETTRRSHSGRCVIFEKEICVVLPLAPCEGRIFILFLFLSTTLTR